MKTNINMNLSNNANKNINEQTNFIYIYVYIYTSLRLRGLLAPRQESLNCKLEGYPRMSYVGLRAFSEQVF